MKMMPAVFFLCAAPFLAHASNIKPADFEPLTTVPWDDENATLPAVLSAIFREPNHAIRYPVLAEYLQHIPAARLEEAFELCLSLEGTQNPDALVEFFLPIWAARDTARCWQRVKKLFRVVGIEEGVLGYDSWAQRPRITVQDRAAIQESPFWITSRALMSFPPAVDRAELPEKERLRILREFTTSWFAAFRSWPGFPQPHQEQKYITWGKTYRDGGQPLLQRLRSTATVAGLKEIGASEPLADLQLEIALRRALLAEPASAEELLRWTLEKWSTASRTGRTCFIPSQESLLLWAKSDLPAIVRWAEALDASSGELGLRAQGLLISLVDLATRERWVAAAKSAPPKEEGGESLFSHWAQWDLAGALAAVAEAGQPEFARGLANHAEYGPWPDQPWNASRDAVQVLSSFDFSKRPPQISGFILEECYRLMEQWDSMDVAGAGQFGFAYLLRTNYAPRDRLIQFFSGSDIYAREDGMIDRTFCALRVWAVVRPQQMRKWIAGLEDAEMRKALTWLLENPWGHGKKEHGTP